MELSVCPLEGSREHAFQITGVWGHGWYCLVLTLPSGQGDSSKTAQ